MIANGSILRLLRQAMISDEIGDDQWMVIPADVHEHKQHHTLTRSVQML